MRRVALRAARAPLVSGAATRGDPDAGAAQARLQRVGALEAFGEAGAAGRRRRPAVRPGRRRAARRRRRDAARPPLSPPAARASSPTPPSSRLPPGTSRLRPPLTCLATSRSRRTSSRLRAIGAGERPRLGRRRAAAAGSAARPLRAAVASLRARASSPPRIRGSSERRPSARVRLPTAVLRCAVGEPLACPLARRSIAAARLLRRRRRRGRARSAISPAPACGAFGALGEQAAARRRPRRARRAARATAPAAPRRPGPSRSSCAEPFRPSAVERRRRARAAASCGAATGPGPITARTPGSRGDPPLPARQQRAGVRWVVIGPRSVGGDEDEGRLPARADGGVDRFRVLAGLVGGRQLVDPRGAGGEGEGRRGQQDQRHRDQERRRRARRGRQRRRRPRAATRERGPGLAAARPIAAGVDPRRRAGRAAAAAPGSRRRR